jgi:hypothetical protein
MLALIIIAQNSHTHISIDRCVVKSEKLSCSQSVEHDPLGDVTQLKVVASKCETVYQL